jgi:hypothetical protein
MVFTRTERQLSTIIEYYQHLASADKLCDNLLMQS